MRFNLEFFDINFEKNGACWISFLTINDERSLIYVEWGRGWIQFDLLFGLISKR
jgi:hypothetical protein